MKTAYQTMRKVAEKHHATYNRANKYFGAGIESESELAIWKMAKSVKALKATPIVNEQDGVYHLTAYKY